MKPTLKVLSYRHHPKYKFVLDLRAFNKGRKFFKTRTEAEAEALRQRTLLERHSRIAVGLSQRDLSDFIHARDRLAGYGKKITDALDFLVDHLERVRRHGITVSQRGIIDRNPIPRTAKPKLIDRPPEIFAVDELRTLLEAATRTAHDVVPMLAIGAFAGLREAEIQRLDWHEIDLARGHIEIKAAK